MAVDKELSTESALLRIVDTFSRKQAMQIHQLYQNEWWTRGRTPSETLAAIEHSQLCLGVIDRLDNVVGFARVLTDFVFKAIVFDVIVKKEWRGQKIGRLIVDTLINHPNIKDVQHFELYCLADLEPFYEKSGFSTDVAGARLMRRNFETKFSGKGETVN